MPNVTQLGVKVDCHLQGGRGLVVIVLPKGEHPEPKTGVSTLGIAER
jgi:hypothetical protein